MSDAKLAAPPTLEALAARLPARARLIGVDLGTKTIGLALSDVERRIATPLVTLARTAFTKDAEALSAQIQKFEAFALIVGLPVNMDGLEGPRAQATRAFARNFVRLHATPIAFWDERLSTAAVTRALIANDVSRAKRAEVVDKMAAAYILQGALDRLASLSAVEPDRLSPFR
jgi:putative Holliday junction resolvase